LDLALTPSTRYFWRVTVWTDTGVITSPTAWFETAKNGRTLAGRVDHASLARPDRASFAAARFASDGEITRARLSICGLGLYEAEINGQRVSDEYLALLQCL